MAKKNNSVMGGVGIALMAILVYLFTNKMFLIGLGVVVLFVIIAVIVKNRKVKPTPLFPKNGVTDAAKEYVQKILDFEQPYERAATDEQDGTMCISPKVALDLIGQVVSFEAEYKQYENLIDPLYKKAIEKKEKFEGETFANQVTYSVWGICNALEQIIVERSENSKQFIALSNLSERLLSINEELFTRLFYAVQGFCFWYIYNKSFEYFARLRMIKKVLEKHNGVKQTDFYKLVGSSKEDTAFTLMYAEWAKEIVREKSGRSYLLYLPDTKLQQTVNQ